MESSASSGEPIFEARGFGRARWTFRRGECWVAVGDMSALCASLAGAPPPRGASLEFAPGVEDGVRLVSFSQQGDAVRAKGGWLQSRYYGSIVSDFGEAEDVREFLSFERARGINPFEVRKGLAAERRAFAREFASVARLLTLAPLLGRPFHTLSNGEARRVLLARALLGAPTLLVLQDPFAGLDPERREQLKGIIDALAARGMPMFICVRHADEVPGCATNVIGGRRVHARPPKRPAAGRVDADAPPVVELKGISISFGRRKLFDGFDWTVRRGERWVLSGPNGSGKTTLFALITGDSPLAYANDVSVFGQRREPGARLADVRRRIGVVSPELQAYSGEGAEELIASALAAEPDLLLLDEPCLNLDAASARRLRRTVSAWLARRPSCTAICIAHRPDDVPAGFDHVMRLDAAPAGAVYAKVAKSFVAQQCS